MRIATASQLLDVEPGTTASVVVDVVNTEGVIDGVSARVIGLSDEFVSTAPAMLPLFPDTDGQVTVTLAIPKTHPAGRHPITVEMVSHGARVASQYLDVDLDVAAQPAMRVAATPQIVRARRGGRFVLEVTNEGNVPIDVVLQAVDVERTVTATFTPATVRVQPGTVTPVLLDVRGPRMFTGGEIERTVAVEVVGDLARGAHEAAEGEPVRRQLTVRLRQRPLIGRGLLTALILAGIVALWALVFLIGLAKVFGGDPPTKTAPASFFAGTGTQAANRSAGAAGAAGAGDAAQPGSGDGSGGGPAANAAAPAGALPKTGTLPAGVGGQVAGTVDAASDGSPVGRILVTAYRRAYRDGHFSIVPVGSAATQSDGTYVIAGLFPTTYYLQFSAPGFTPVWYPAAAAQPQATPLAVAAQSSQTDVNATIKGRPASMSGTIDPGDTLSTPTTTVVARPLASASTGAPTASNGGDGGAVAATTVTSDGKYTLNNLPAPGSYQLTFTTPGYQTSTLVDTVNGGEQRLESTVVLGASVGSITGTVSSGGTPLGGATVTTTVNGSALAIGTPTEGQVGTYTLANLPTPATYVVTVSDPGHGTDTTIVDLGAGQSRSGYDIALADGTGSVTGTVTGGNGKGLGGVTVSVGGGTSTASTTTITNGPGVGTYAINDLASPGTYTLTFTQSGYSPVTVPLSLSDSSASKPVNVQLASNLGSISGLVTLSGQGYAGATVTATNGTTSVTTTSNSKAGSTPAGYYLITGLSPGTYSVTVTANGLNQQTRFVVVGSKAVRGQDLALSNPGSGG